MNPTRRDVLKYIGMAPFAGLVPAAAPVTVAECYSAYSLNMTERSDLFRRAILNGQMTRDQVRAMEGLLCQN